MATSNEPSTDEEYPQSRRINGCFSNSFNPQFQMPNYKTLMKWVFTEKNETSLPNPTELETQLPVIRHKKDEVFVNENGLHFLWIGHASCLVQMDDFVFLTDPVFSDRCGVTSFLGPKRYRPPALQVEDLPDRLQAILISHNHFDHLDSPSVQQLNTRYGDKLTWYCGVGVSAYLTSCGITNTIELNWWDDVVHRNNEKVNISFCPAQHWSRRGILDQNKTLWGGFVVNNGKYKFYFAGDTGYTNNINVFKLIGKKYGPFDLSAIPIGAYQPRWMMEAQHVSPVEAVQIHLDVKSKKSIGIHWGTWALANEFYLEPKTKLAEVVQNQQLAENSFCTVKHGEIIDLP